MPHFGPFLGPAASRESQQLVSELINGVLAAYLALHTMGMEKMFGWKTKNNARSMRMMDTSGAYNGGRIALTHGWIATTRIATAMGWRAVDAIAVGDGVLTFDNGMQRVTDVHRATFWVGATDVPKHMWNVHIPAGALGNFDAITVLPHQGLLIESDAAVDQFGDPFAVVPAASLAGVLGITRQPPRQSIDVVTLSFADEQVIYAEGNLLTHCPANKVTLDDMLSQKKGTYDVLNSNDAAFLAECIAIERQAVAA